MKNYLKIAFLILVAYSCVEEPVETVFFAFDSEKGVFISCEGNFMYGNGSLSFYNTEKGEVSNQIFYARNNAPLGDVVQSLALKDDFLFILVNNSGKVYVTDVNTIEFKGSITGLTSPRYIHFVSDDKAYISDLYARHLTVFNPRNFQITGKIDLGSHTSEQMVQIEKYIFVSHWVNGKELLVIDTELDKMTGKINVPFQPKELKVDKNGKIWVLSGGNYLNSPVSNDPSALSRIDPQTLTVEQIYRFDEGLFSSSLSINQTGDTIYYLNGDVFKMHIGSRHLPESAFIPAGDKLFYNLAIHPGNNDIYVADAIDYTQDAIVYRYSRGGAVIDSFKVGINPSCFLFR